MRTANQLSLTFPHLVHIEATSFNHPTYEQLEELYIKNTYNISDNYSLHLYHKREYFIPDNFEQLDAYNCTLGRAMRIVMYESPELRSENNLTNGYKLEKQIIEDRPTF